jgi:hypothetical protein
VCETAAHLWLQQLPFFVVQMHVLPAHAATAVCAQTAAGRALLVRFRVMVNMRSRGTLATVPSNICDMDGATALYAHAL